MQHDDISALVDAIGKELCNMQNTIAAIPHQVETSYFDQWNSQISEISGEINQFSADCGAESDFHLECPTENINVHGFNIDTLYAMVVMVNQLRVTYSALDDHLVQLSIYCPNDMDSIDVWRHCLDLIWLGYAAPLESELDSVLDEYERLC